MGDRLGIPGAVGFLLSTAILSPFMTKMGLSFSSLHILYQISFSMQSIYLGKIKMNSEYKSRRIFYVDPVCDSMSAPVSVSLPNRPSCCSSHRPIVRLSVLRGPSIYRSIILPFVHPPSYRPTVLYIQPYRRTCTQSHHFIPSFRVCPSIPPS